MQSIRRVYVIIEAVTLVVTLCFVFILLAVLRDHVREGYIRGLTSDISKIDISIESFVTDNVSAFRGHLALKDRAEALRHLSHFSDIYHVSNRFVIDQIIKKNPESKIFIGYDVGSSGLGIFLKKTGQKDLAYSPMYRSAENEQLSFYIAVKQQSGYFVGRIDLDQLLRNLSRISEYSRSIIMLATRDGYVLSSSSKDIPVSVLPRGTQREIIINDGKYLISRIPSAVFENDIVMLAPLSTVYGIVASMTKYYIFFMCFVVIAFVVKIVLQTKLFIRPLSGFAAMLQEWDVDSKTHSVPESFMKYQEILLLYQSFTDKSREIHEAVEAIRENEHEMNNMRLYLKNIIDSMPSMLISVDDKDTIHEWNQAATLFTGIPASSAIGKKIWDILPVLEKHREAYREAAGSRAPKQFGIESVKDDDDCERYINISIFPLVQNGIREIAIRIDDVTELERTEQQLRQAQKMETIGTLVGGLAHDFNNILSGIVGTLSLMKFHLQRPGGLDPSRMEDYLVTMENAGQRAADLIKQMLILSRKQELVFRPVDLNKVLANVVKICSNTFDRRITISIRHHEEAVMARADSVQMEQVFLNLCINAMHAMTTMRKDGEEHGGSLAIEISRIIVDEYFLVLHPDARNKTDYWKISVQDNGVGMDVKTVAKIFDPFFSTKETGKGTGLGLTMVYNIVRQHKGFIDVYSEPGKGSTFNIYIPVLEDQHVLPDIAGDTMPATGQGTVLVIDDEEQVRSVTREMLESCGYSVLTANDGEEGITTYKKYLQKIDLVILDINMPKISGTEAYVQLKQTNRDVKVIVASGFIKDKKADDLIEMGAQRFIQKPYTLNSLLQVVADTLKE